MIHGQDKPFQLRITILDFLRCYLYKNDFGKNMILSTLSYQSEIGKLVFFKKEKIILFILFRS
jgi:hypothetical protein